MTLPLYHIDAFTDRLFKGNQAAVVPLTVWLPDEALQQIAAENNLSETAFFVKPGETFEIRWFTPKVEVDLCGHGTLAAAHVIFQHEGYAGDEITLTSRSGILHVRKSGEFLTLDFPADPPQKASAPAELLKSLARVPRAVLKGKEDWLLVFQSQQEIVDLKPDFGLMQQAKCRGVIVTAHGDSVDFVSRFFAPAVGINEDPVTGSAHTTLTPYWAEKLGRNQLTALQLSRRGGSLKCRLAGDRVEISGQAVTYLIGEIFLPS